jgi:hypothetical protein
MGNSLRCLSLWRGSKDGSKDDIPAAALSLTFGDVLEKLPPNHLRNRLDPSLPNISISNKIFWEIQELLPVHHRSLKWEQLFSTEESGFSTQSFISACREHGKRHEAGMLLIKTAAQCVVGVYLPMWIDWQQRKYFGTRGTLVLTIDETTETMKSFAASGNNEYFLRTTTSGELSVGGGGRGPAIKLCNDLLEIQSSTECPTFADYSCLLPQGNSEVVVEAGTAQAGVALVELWGFSKKSFK